MILLLLIAALQVDIPEVHTEKGGELMSVLNIMLAKAINLQDRSGAAQIRETLRCISLLEPEDHGKLILRLREEHRARSPYIAYLVRSRQGLLANQATLESLCKRMEIEQRMSSKFLITVCVRSDLSQDIMNENVTFSFSDCSWRGGTKSSSCWGLSSPPPT